MRILLTNDDGIMAPGLLALHDALEGLGEIVTFAPKTVQSATSHGITYSEPLMVEEVEMKPGVLGTAVDGRPADCVKLALRSLWEERFGEGSRPDLTISGMNSGANIGINVIYSGTVAAAVESAFLGIPAIAVSLLLADRNRIEWARAATIARTVIDRVLERTLDAHEVVNINIPKTESPDRPMPEIRVVGMNSAPLEEGYDRRVSPDGQVYYWAAGTGLNFTRTSPGSDVEAVLGGHISVTPLSYVMTDDARMQTWRDVFE
ncbi:MAG: 5'/3'-nucleotidase SurE [Phycisphaerales bacterium]|nr:5'/3'-nucleotidase SurE [Phycisphaerales bacterium]